MAENQSKTHRRNKEQIGKGFEFIRLSLEHDEGWWISRSNSLMSCLFAVGGHLWCPTQHKHWQLMWASLSTEKGKPLPYTKYFSASEMLCPELFCGEGTGESDFLVTVSDRVGSVFSRHPSTRGLHNCFSAHFSLSPLSFLWIDQGKMPTC